MSPEIGLVTKGKTYILTFNRLIFLVWDSCVLIAQMPICLDLNLNIWESNYRYMEILEGLVDGSQQTKMLPGAYEE